MNNVVTLYWDLVCFNDSLKVKQQTLELNTQLYNDNKRRAELGALAEIDIIQAEAEMKSSQQDVVTAETQVLQQEMILKSVLIAQRLRNPADRQRADHAHRPLRMSAQDAVSPTQDLVAEAFQKRPEMRAEPDRSGGYAHQHAGHEEQPAALRSAFSPTSRITDLPGGVNSLPGADHGRRRAGRHRSATGTAHYLPTSTASSWAATGPS